MQKNWGKSFIADPANAILFFALLQVLCSTYFLQIENFYWLNSILFLIAGFGISFCLLKVPEFKIDRKNILNKQLLIKILIVILLLPVSYQLARQIMDSTPLQFESADMLPIMKTMSQRFLNGEWKEVYKPIPEIWNGIQPIYLPAMWLPFSASVIFHFDMRWITVCGIWLSVLMCIFPLWKQRFSAIIFSAAILILLTSLHFDEENNVIRFTEEGVVFFYYSLMVVAIISRSAWLIGISAALYLLSRYSIVGWIPFAALYFILTKQYKFLLKAITAGLAVILILVILPFGFKPLLLQLQVQQHYISHAQRVWHDNPEFYYQSLGMAKFFGPSHIQLLHYFLLTGTFLLPLAFLLWKRKKLLTEPNILLVGFQLGITFFYNFLDVSYSYLYYTPVFVSLCIAGWVLGSNKNKLIHTVSLLNMKEKSLFTKDKDITN